MKVYILEHRWDNADNEGGEIQVFSHDHLDMAREAMREAAEKIRAKFRGEDGTEPWEQDYTWEDENAIHLGFTDLLYGTVYAWEIYERPVL